MENEAKGSRFEVSIDLGNDAFREDANGEISRILKDLAREVSEGIVKTSGKVDIKDVNGNTVGMAKFVGVRDEEEFCGCDISPAEGDDEDEELSVTKAMESDDPFVNVGMIAQMITRDLTPGSLEEAKKRKRLKKSKRAGKGKK